MLNWIETRQADPIHGEWHQRIGSDGIPVGDKAGEWKCPYHTTRAMLECLRRVDQLKVR
jgi:mannobiose 2-epimerase